MLGYVGEIDLPIIYKLADMFVYPSLYEGFGLPLLEAMASGCPVIGTVCTVADEIVGNAGLLVDTSDSIKLMDAMLFLSNGDNQKKYGLKGIEQSNNFSWKKCAIETSNLYNLFFQ